MASNTMATWHKRTRKHKNGGRKRKNKEARQSTLSAADLFAGFGEPGKPAPAGGAPKVAKKAAAPAKKKAPAAAAKKSPAA